MYICALSFIMTMTSWQLSCTWAHELMVIRDPRHTECSNLTEAR